MNAEASAEVVWFCFQALYKSIKPTTGTNMWKLTEIPTKKTDESHETENFHTHHFDIIIKI